jgi:RNA polymerase sigma factor (sigma-70 family)
MTRRAKDLVGDRCIGTRSSASEDGGIVGTQALPTGNSPVVEATGSSAPSDAQAMAASVVDTERFTAIVERHFPEIFRYLVRRTGRDAADDLAAETFVVAFRNRHRYDPTRSDARPWLYGIATNVVRRHRRTEVRQLAAYARAVSSLPVEADNTANAADRLDAESSLVAVASAFSQLEEEQRDALYLVAVADLTYAEAAEALGMKLGTLHSRVARGRARLRDLVARSGQHREGPSMSTVAEQK